MSNFILKDSDQRSLTEPKKGTPLARVFLAILGTSIMRLAWNTLSSGEFGFNQNDVSAVIPFAMGLIGAYLTVSAIEGHWIRP